MGNYDNKKSMLRYAFISMVMALIALSTVARAIYIATVERDYWTRVQAKVIRDSVVIPSTRGNVLGSGGEQLSCNLPEYRIYMDYGALKATKADTLWHDSLYNETEEFKALVKGLHEIFPSSSEEDFRELLHRGYDNNDRHQSIWKHRIDYTTYNKVKALPIFSLKQNIGGFHCEEFMVRNRPYGQMASSIVGSMYKEKGTPYSGLELAYDTLLRGKPGIVHRRKVLNSWVSLNDTLAIDGCDLVSTIDVGIQDLAERALIKELTKDNAYTGVAIVMEVQTGDIKAMVSLDRDSTGTGYHETERNHAISDWLEPGSVFKTASFMVAIDDGFITDTAHTYVDTGNGIREMYHSFMRDHNWNRGGYGRINVPKILQVSSNIGVSVLIDKYYAKQPEKFVEGIHRIGLAENLHLPFQSYMPPKVRMPERNKRGQFTNWYKTTLPWMSIGYETNVPPISMLTFYNAIANNGKMVKPRFVTRAEKDGVVVQEFPTEVLRESICKPQTLSIIQDMLEKVVSIGLGKPAAAKGFRVAGKTGTAQKAHNGSYKNGPVDYLLTFAGYFPYDDPKYSCIVCIQKTGLPASGGGMSGHVFQEIAEGIYAKNIVYSYTQVRDSATVHIPQVKYGNTAAAEFVMSRLYLGDKKPQLKPVTNYAKDVMPDVHGMGARDAVYAIETRGARVTLKGRGKVVGQSKPAGEKIIKGQRVYLDLS